jgi:hypothetical protein
MPTNAVLTGLKNGEEGVFPDAFSQAIHQVFLQSPKQLEQQFAATLG